eukprot:3270084-Pyramimonas_sp.AAC.1
MRRYPWSLRRTGMGNRSGPVCRPHSHGYQSSLVCAGLWLRDSEWIGAEDLPQIPCRPDMSRRPTPRNTAAQE